jgi:hypothetical protein
MRDGTLRSFPGAQPVSVTKSDLPTIQNGTFLVGLKTDGQRFLLLLMMLDDEPRAIMINRRLEMREIESVWAPESYYLGDGTLLDGELVWEQRAGRVSLSQLFLIFDIVAAREPLTHLVFSERLTRIHKHVLSELPARATTQSFGIEETLLDEDRIYLCADNLRMAPKRFVAAKDGLEMWRARGMSQWKNDGLIFVSNTTPLETNTAFATLKWKPLHTIDVERDNEGVVVSQRRGRRCNLETVDVLGQQRRIAFDQSSELLACIGATTAVLECSCTVTNDAVVLTPLKVRHDKSMPNEVSTIAKTVQNAIEAITVEALFGAAEAESASRASEVVPHASSECNGIEANESVANESVANESVARRTRRRTK